MHELAPELSVNCLHCLALHLFLRNHKKLQWPFSTKQDTVCEYSIFVRVSASGHLFYSPLKYLVRQTICPPVECVTENEITIPGLLRLLFVT